MAKPIQNFQEVEQRLMQMRSELDAKFAKLDNDHAQVVQAMEKLQAMFSAPAEEAAPREKAGDDHSFDTKKAILAIVDCMEKVVRFGEGSNTTSMALMNLRQIVEPPREEPKVPITRG